MQRRHPQVPNSPTWEQVEADYRAAIEDLRRRAGQLHAIMVKHVLHEASRTGADIRIVPPGTVLAKDPQDGQIALRLIVTGGTALYARQAHVPEPPGEKHRSWRVELDDAPRLSGPVRNGLSGMIETIARLQGRTWETPQGSLDLE